MRALYPGHLYELNQLDGPGKTILQFVSRQPLHPAVAGVTCQEVIRALIDRVGVLDAEMPWPGNGEIMHHLRMAMTLFEVRALLRHVEKGEIKPEVLPVGEDGHFIIADGAIRPRPEAASPVTEGQAPASTVQPPSSQESGVGETEGWRIFHAGDNPRPDVEWSGYLPDEAASGPAIAYSDDAGAALFVVWWDDIGNGRSQITRWRDLPAEFLSAPRPSQREG